LVIPFFENYPIYGAKFLDFQAFCQGITIIKNKEHLTQQGLDRLKDLAYSYEYLQKILMYILFFNFEKVCRGSMRIDLLLYCYVLGKPYIKFIHILNNLNKMNKKILCFFYILPLWVFYILKKGVNQQETLGNLSVLRLNYLTSDEGLFRGHTQYNL